MHQTMTLGRIYRCREIVIGAGDTRSRQAFSPAAIASAGGLILGRWPR